MKNELSDEQLDDRLRQVFDRASLDDDTVNDIADSPAIWWGVQRRINERKAPSSVWPPVNAWRRWLLIGVPAAAAAAVAIGFFGYRAPIMDHDIAGAVQPQPVFSVPVQAPGTEKVSRPDPTDVSPPGTLATRSFHIAKAVSRPAAVSKRSIKTDTAVTKHSEIKTDFIALSYARDPDSGQIVRVKVPSSMLVTLGVVASVDKPTDMVDAEVLVGDDGLTRAIRFVR